ncbi:cell division protein ZapE [Oceaniovalibus guishaninsula]|nr:cell division protein ZapE [Oceaniovalibus guishaninsula]
MSDFTDIYDRQVADGAVTDDPAQRAVLTHFDRLAGGLQARPARRGWFRRSEPPALRGLYLWGGVGRGKSMLMNLFFGNIGIEGKRRAHFHAFMQEVHAGIAKARKRGVDDAILPVADEMSDGLRLLCFDEMQIGDITDAMIVGRLFERLFANGVVIVTTSNRPPGGLYKDGLNRQLFLPFIALLEDRMEVVELASPRDWRQDRDGGSAAYFVPHDADARRAMDAIWNDLAGKPGTELTLRVAGRDVVLPAFANGVARATFWDLCGRPLGAADYLALADAIDVLILEGVPRLSSENYNEARRFVTLIDALYEGRVRLVMSAADVPDSLYVEGEGAFEFARTASRLAEMQSDGWRAD